MKQHSKERKEAILNKVLSNPNKSIREIAAEEDIAKTTLYSWLQKFKDNGHKVKSRSTKQNNLNSEEKFMHVLATSSLDEQALNAYCREQGFYPQDITAWKSSCLNANATTEELRRIAKAEAREDKKRIQALEKELKRKEKALAETAALLVLRKKLNALYSSEEEEI